MKRISSRHNPLVSRCRALARGDADEVLLDGHHLVADALTAEVSLRQVIVASTAMERSDIRDLLDMATRRGAATATASASVMSALSPSRSPTDLIAIAARPSVSVSQILSSSAPLVVVAADIQDPGNVGAIARVAEAAGADGMIVSGHSADPFGWKALRGSMGSALRLPIFTTPDTGAAIQAARTGGCRIIATVPREGQSPTSVDFRQPAALVLGGEGRGLGADLIHAIDLKVTIPMNAPVESLNVAVAAALLLYEARRQRQNH